MEIFYLAFADLSTCRQLGQAEGPIPWNLVEEWCDRNGIEGEQRDDLKYYVGQMDNVYLKHRANEIKKSAPKLSGVTR